MSKDKPERFEIEISGLAYGGNGVGRLNNFVYFIPGTIPGERVLAEKISQKKNYGFAKPVEILRNSQKRIPHRCPLFFQPGEEFYCPGCSYQHMEYEEEVAHKNLQFIRFLEMAGYKSDADKIQPPCPSASDYGYRNKIVLHPASDGESRRCLGYYSNDNKSILRVDSCPIARTEINRCLSEICESDAIDSIEDGCARATIRFTEMNGASFWFGTRPPDNGWLEEKTAVGNISVPKGSFFQVNQAACDMLVSKLMEHLKSSGAERLLDLYCGCGLFSVAAGKAGLAESIGVDSDQENLKAAKFNASQSGLKKSRFVCAPCENAFAGIAEGLDRSRTMLLLDPPRGGLPKKLLELICRSDLKNIIYISCAPDTMSRDLKDFKASGYGIVSAEIVDMFPKTARFESIVRLGK